VSEADTLELGAMALRLHDAIAMRTTSILFAVAALGVAACHDNKPAQGPAERAGEKVDDAAEDTKDATKEAADDTKEAAEDTKSNVERKTDEDNVENKSKKKK
jgi:hypothetical protein